MPASLTNILDEVNDLLAALPYASNTTFYKLAYLQTKNDREGNDRTFPIVRRGQSEAYQISPQDVKSMIFYHRLIEETDEPIPDQGKGTDAVKFTTYTVRLVALGHRRKLTSLNDEDNADLARAVKLLLNGKTLSDKSKIWPIEINSDKIEIFEEEFAGYDFNRDSLEITAFTVDYNIRQRIVCSTALPVSYTLTSVTGTNTTQTASAGNLQTIVITALDANGKYLFSVDANDSLPSGATLTATSLNTCTVTFDGSTPLGSYTLDIIGQGYGNTSGVGQVTITLLVTADVNTETQDFVSQLNSEGYTLPPESDQLAISTYIDTAKTGGWWDLEDEVYVLAINADADAACVSLKNPTGDHYLRRVNSPVYTAGQGIAGNGVNAYLNPRLELNKDTSNYSQDDASISVYVRNNSNDSGNIIRGITSRNALIAGSTVLHKINSTTDLSLAYDASQNGYYHLDRSDSANLKIYLDGSLDLDASQPSTNLYKEGLIFLAISNISVVAGATSSEISFISIGASQSAYSSAKNASVQTLLTSLGAI